MSDKLPRITPDDAIRILLKAGFVLTRQSGSHKIYKNNLRKRVTISYHKAKIIHPKVLRSILEDAGLTVEEFRELL